MITAKQVIELKAKIKEEMLRRNGHGSLVTYGDSQYDFTINPVANELIMLEHGQKTIDLLLKIEDYGDLTLSKKDSLIPSSFTDELITEIDRLASESKTGLNTEISSCRGDCTGLCVASCIGLCNGCTGCTATCGIGCATGCYSNCTGSCNTNCNSGCFSECTGATKTTGR